MWDKFYRVQVLLKSWNFGRNLENFEKSQNLDFYFEGGVGSLQKPTIIKQQQYRPPAHEEQTQ